MDLKVFSSGVYHFIIYPLYIPPPHPGSRTHQPYTYPFLLYTIVKIHTIEPLDIKNVSCDPLVQRYREGTMEVSTLYQVPSLYRDIILRRYFGGEGVLNHIKIPYYLLEMETIRVPCFISAILTGNAFIPTESNFKVRKYFLFCFLPTMQLLQVLPLIVPFKRTFL